jgi:phage baseplate assembly protein W
MARIIYKAYPPDTKLDKAVGILLPFNRNTFVKSALEAYNKKPSRDVGPFKLSYTTEEQAISNLINLLMTRKSERYMQPNFGTILRDFVFEQNSSFNRGFLESSLEEDIGFWLPYIVLKDLSVGIGGNQNYGYSEQENSVNVRITFSVTERGANRTVIIYNSGNDLAAEIL